MKYEVLRKKFLMDAGIFGGAALLLSAVAFGVDMLHSSVEDQKSRLNSQISSLTSEKSSLQAQLVKAKESLLLYDTINRKNQNAGLELNRDSATKLLDSLKDSYRLSKLNLKLSPVETVKDEAYQKKTVILISSNVTLDFEGLTDAHLNAFATAVKVKFPGYVRFTKFNVSRVSGLSKDVFLSITKGTIPSLVKGQMEFKWLGLKSAKGVVDPNAPPPEGGT